MRDALTHRWFIRSSLELLRLSGQSLRSLWRRREGERLSTALLGVALLPPAWAWFLVQWAGLLLDELLFPAYRAIEIREPVFVLGVPRSGTTALHRLLALDDRFTTLRTWHCLVAPSISLRRSVHALRRADARIGRPLARALAALERGLERWLGAVHATGLDDPEEDYLTLLPILRSFILIVAFPSNEAIWRMGFFDRDVPEAERERILAFYRSCLQRHLLAEGSDRRILSKNAAFASWAGSLRRAFPGARIVVCTRDPREALPSQLSALQLGLDLFGRDVREGDWGRRIGERLGYGYLHLWDELHALPPERGCLVDMEEIRDRPAATVRRIYRELGMRLPEELAARLERADAEARGFRAEHRYRLEDYGLSESEVLRRFGPVYARYGWLRTERAAAGS